MKRCIGIFLAVLMLSAIMTGCGTQKSLRDENLSEICTLGQYKGIEITQKSIDEQVASALESLLSSKATTEEITDRPAQKGDTVEITYAGVSEGETFDSGTMEVEIGSGETIDGFEDAIIGLEIGKTTIAELTFPESYPNNPDLAGKPATFTITLDGITANVQPELTDSFIAENTDYKTIEEYRTETAADYLETTIWEAVIANAKISSYPKDYVKEYYDAQIESLENSMLSYGMTLNQYISMLGLSNTSFAQQIVDSAKQTVKQIIVVYMIADAESITVSEEEYQAKLTELAEAYALTEEEVLKNISREDIELEALADKVMSFTADAAAVITD